MLGLDGRDKMIRCSECDAYYPHDSDIATCIREFGRCVECKIHADDFYEDDLMWIKFVRQESGLDSRH